MLNIFHAWYQNTSILVYTAWRGIFQRDNILCDLVRFRFAAVVIDATFLSQR